MDLYWLMTIEGSVSPGLTKGVDLLKKYK